MCHDARMTMMDAWIWIKSVMDDRVDIPNVAVSDILTVI